jgi:hypothetical protein
MATLAVTLAASPPSIAQLKDVKEFCWRDSYGRGVGTVPQSCEAGRDRIGLLCYTKCGQNSKRVGFDCHSVCPDGMRDDGLFCRKAEYGRGAGYAWRGSDGLSDKGMFRRCEADHGAGKCEKNGAIVYPKCKPGYSNVGCCICRPSKPDCSALGLGGQVDLSCAKIVKIGDPVTGTCGSGQQKDAGLCYPGCRSGYKGVGPVCWSASPTGWVECGMGAAKDKTTCGSITFSQVASVGNVALTVVSLGTSTAATGTAGAATDAAKLTKLKQAYKEMKAAYEAAKPAIQAVVKAKKAAGVVIDAGEILVSEDQVTEEDILRLAAQIAAIADPTGVSDTVAAYTYPMCSKYFASPAAPKK